MESIIVGIILGLLVLFILITLNKILNKERELNQKMGYRLSRILNQVTQILDANKNFEYQWNQPGSGHVCYASADAVVIFNEFPEKFEGFYVNNKEVTFRELLEVIT